MEKKNKLSDRGVTPRSIVLDGVSVAMAVCGGIGSVEVVKIIREFRRHGARVTVFVTPTVSRFVTHLSLEWAAESAVIVEVGAEVDHLNRYDLVVVVPATLNTIAKVAAGLCDNAVTLLLASQFGQRGKVLFVPAMNHVLKNHPLYAEEVKRLKSWGAEFLESVEEEARLKVPDRAVVVQAAISLLES